MNRKKLITSTILGTIMLGSLATTGLAIAQDNPPAATNVSPWICEDQSGNVYGFGHGKCPAYPASRTITFTAPLIEEVDIPTNTSGQPTSMLITYTDGQKSSLNCTIPTDVTPPEFVCK